MSDRPEFRAETFLGLTKQAAARLFLLISVLAVTGLLALVIFRVTEGRTQVRANQEAIARNRAALAYICSTTSILDGLVVQVRTQIDASFKNGTYEKLEKRGVVSKENVIEAHRTRAKYQAAHLKLKHNGACRTATGR